MSCRPLWTLLLDHPTPSSGLPSPPPTHPTENDPGSSAGILNLRTWRHGDDRATSVGRMPSRHDSRRRECNPGGRNRDLVAPRQAAPPIYNDRYPRSLSITATMTVVGPAACQSPVKIHPRRLAPPSQVNSPCLDSPIFWFLNVFVGFQQGDDQREARVHLGRWNRAGSANGPAQASPGQHPDLDHPWCLRALKGRANPWFTSGGRRWAALSGLMPVGRQALGQATLGDRPSRNDVPRG